MVSSCVGLLFFATISLSYSFNDLNQTHQVVELDTPSKNLLIASPDGFEQANYSFGSMPFADEIGDLGNGQGITISTSSGNGFLLYGPVVNTGNGLIRIRCTVRCDDPNVSLALAALNAPADGGLEDIDGSLGTNQPANGAQFAGTWKTLELFYNPDGDAVVPVFQAVGTSSEPAVVYIDQIAITALRGLAGSELNEALDLYTPTPTPTETPFRQRYTSTPTPVKPDTYAGQLTWNGRLYDVNDILMQIHGEDLQFEVDIFETLETVSVEQSAPLPEYSVNVWAEVTEGNAYARVLEQPRPWNDYTVKIVLYQAFGDRSLRDQTIVVRWSDEVQAEPTFTPWPTAQTNLPTPTPAQSSKVLWILNDDYFDESGSTDYTSRSAGFIELAAIFADKGLQITAIPGASTMLTSELLQEYQIVVFCDSSPKYPITDMETEALREFVESGGSLLTFGFDEEQYIVGSGSVYLNSICRPFGIQYGGSSRNNVVIYRDHYTVQDVRVIEQEASELTMRPPAQAAALKGNGNAVLAISEYGQGRVVAVSDGSAFYDNDVFHKRIEYGDHRPLISNIVVWLLHQEEAFPIIAPEPTPTFLPGSTNEEAQALATRMLEANEPWLNPEKVWISYGIIRILYGEPTSYGPFTYNRGGPIASRVGSIVWTPLHIMMHDDVPYSVRSAGRTNINGIDSEVILVEFESYVADDIGLGGQAGRSFAHGGYALKSCRIAIDPERAVPLRIECSDQAITEDQNYFPAVWTFEPEYFEINGGYAPHIFERDQADVFRERQEFQIAEGIWIYKTGDAWSRDGSPSHQDGEHAVTVNLVDLELLEQNSTPTPTPPPENSSLTFRAYIDGIDNIHIQGNRLWYEHLLWAKPGLQNGNNFLTTINGEDWQPTWQEDTSNKFTADEPLIQTDEGFFYTVDVLEGRGIVGLIQIPNSGNDYETIVYVYDNGGGAGWYEFTVNWSETPPYDVNENEFYWAGKMSLFQDAPIDIHGSGFTVYQNLTDSLVATGSAFGSSLPGYSVNLTAEVLEGDIAATIFEQPRPWNDFTARAVIEQTSDGTTTQDVAILFRWGEEVEPEPTATPWPTWDVNAPTPTPLEGAPKVLWIVMEEMFPEESDVVGRDFLEFGKIFKEAGAVNNVVIAGDQPVTDELLAGYAAVVFGDTRNLSPLTDDETMSVLNYVRGGGSIFVISAQTSEVLVESSSIYATSITKPFGIEFSVRALENSEFLADHPLLYNVTDLSGRGSELLIESPAEALATIVGDKVVLAIAEEGYGRVVAYSDESPFLSRDLELEGLSYSFNSRQFAKNITNWMLKKEDLISATPTPPPGPYLHWQGELKTSFGVSMEIQGSTVTLYDKSWDHFITTSSVFSEPLPDYSVNVSAYIAQGNATVTVDEQPRPWNNFTAKLSLSQPPCVDQMMEQFLVVTWGDEVEPEDTPTPWPTTLNKNESSPTPILPMPASGI